MTRWLRQILRDAAEFERMEGAGAVRIDLLHGAAGIMAFSCICAIAMRVLAGG
ncbi:MAG: hypothetical protein WBA68_10140 [Alteraurantiacibacter sp.]